MIYLTFTFILNFLLFTAQTLILKKFKLFNKKKMCIMHFKIKSKQYQLPQFKNFDRYKIFISNACMKTASFEFCLTILYPARVIHTRMYGVFKSWERKSRGEKRDRTVVHVSLFLGSPSEISPYFFFFTRIIRE